MRHLVTTILMLGAVALLAGSCSVKENRVPCPAYLVVNVVEDERIASPVGMVGWVSDELFRHSLDLETDGRTWTTALKKGSFHFGAYSGVRSASDDGHRLVIPAGHQCDSLYAFYTPVELEEESTVVDVEMRKQFATVIVDLNQSATSMSRMKFLVTGNSCGFDLNGFKPVEGEFRYEPSVPSGSRTVSFRVPRQGDNSLRMELTLPDGLELNPLRLGEIIDAMGYSWKTDELQDIFVSLDFQYGIITITVEGWEEGVTIPMIII